MADLTIQEEIDEIGKLVRMWEYKLTDSAVLISPEVGVLLCKNIAYLRRLSAYLMGMEGAKL